MEHGVSWHVTSVTYVSCHDNCHDVIIMSWHCHDHDNSGQISPSATRNLQISGEWDSFVLGLLKVKRKCWQKFYFFAPVFSEARMWIILIKAGTNDISVGAKQQFTLWWSLIIRTCPEHHQNIDNWDSTRFRTRHSASQCLVHWAMKRNDFEFKNIFYVPSHLDHLKPRLRQPLK